MMVERYPILKEEIGGSIHGCEIPFFTWQKTCQVVNYTLYFGASLSTFCLKKYHNESFIKILAKNKGMALHF